MWMDRTDQKEFAQVNGADPVFEVARAQADVDCLREPIDREPIDRAADRATERRKLGVDRRARTRNDRRKE